MSRWYHERVVSPARSLAFHVLLRVDVHGGYASDLLAHESIGMDSRDASLATEIVLGVLRRRAQLDHSISMATRKQVASLDPEVANSLRMGIFQIQRLDRIPLHAIVNDSVQLVKNARKASAAGLVNAVLRRTPKTPPAWPTREVELSMPEWLLTRWDSQFGADVTRQIAETFLVPPVIYVRNPPPEANVVVEPADIPGSFRFISGSTAGLHVQDVSSQSIVPLLELKNGMTFLDLCAAPGNKTAQALETPLQAIACDRHLHRLRTVGGCNRVVLDATGDLPFRGTFDRVLADVPCSGTGTLGRNPEIRWRLRPEDIPDLHRRQAAILRQAITAVAPGGRLVYSTCSLEREEDEDVVAEVVSGRGDISLLAEHRRTPGISEGDGFYAAVLKRNP